MVKTATINFRVKGKVFLKELAIILGCLFLFFNTEVLSQDSEKKKEDIHFADPTIFLHKGTYYLYGTVEAGSDSGFKVYTSTNLKSWTLSTQNGGYALKRGEAFGSKGFWAPQVFYYNQKFYMAYVANENIAIAESNHPLGPFKQTTLKSLTAPVKQIDPFVFIDDDGKKYLYQVRLTNGNRIFVAELTDDFSSIKEETLRECIAATEPWENTANAKWPVAEGTSMIKHKGLYYLFYSANDFRNPNYAVGYATSNSPLGPWKKYEKNPILYKDLVGVNGPGHGDFFLSRKKLFYVLHTHNSASKVGPRRTALVEVRFESKRGEEKVTIRKKSFRYLKRALKF